MARVSQAKIELIINDEQAQEKLKNLAVRYKKLSEARDAAAEINDFDAMKSLDKDLNAIGKEVKQMQREVVDVEKVLQKLNQVPTKDLRAAVAKLSLDMSKLDRNTVEYKEKAEKLAKIQNELAASAGRASDRVQGFWGKLRKTIFTFDLSSAVSGVMNYAKRASDAYAQFDDKLADVQKTTGLAKESVEELSTSLAKIDTRTSQNELLGLATQAGKLGLSAKEDVERFTIAADKIGVALGEDLGDKEQAINSIGKLVDLFKLKDQYEFGDAMLKVGSAVNSLGAASTANEGYIVDFLSRTGGIGVSANLSATAIMGLGATFDALNQPVEASATVMNKLVGGMFSKTSEYAKVAKMDLKSFSELLKNDTNEAMLRVLEGMKGQDLGYTVQMLGEVGEKGARAAAAVATISNSIDMVRAQQALASAEFEKGTSILDEFNTKNNTAQARREKQQKELVASLVELGRALQPILDLFYSGVITVSQALRMLINVISEYKWVVLSLTAGVIAYNAQSKIQAAWENTKIGLKKLSVLWSKASKEALWGEVLVLQVETKALQSGSLATSNYSKGQKALIALKALLTGQFRAAAVAAKAFLVSIGPIGWIITAVTALGVATGFMNRELGKAGDAYAEFGFAMSQETSTYDDLKKQLAETSEGTRERAELINLINERYKDYHSGLLTEKNTTEEIATALDSATAAMKRNIIETLRKAELQRIEQGLLDTQTEAITKLMDEYAKSGDKTEQQMALFASHVATLTNDAKKGAVTMADIRELFVKMGEDEDRVRTLMINSDNQMARRMQTVYSYFLNIRKAATLANASVFAVNKILPNLGTGETGGGDDGVCKKCKKTPCVCGSGDKTKWSLEGDEKFAAARVALKRQQLNGELATEEQYSKALLDLETTTLEARINSNKEKGKELEKLKEQLLDKQLQQAKAAKSREEKLAKEMQGGDTDLQKAAREYEEKKRALGLHSKEVEQMTASEKAALLQIEKAHASKLKQINLSDLQRQVEEGKKSIERKITALKMEQDQELAAAQTLEQKKKLLEGKFSKEQCARIKTDKEAQRLIEAMYAEKQQQATEKDLAALGVTIKKAVDQIESDGGLFGGLVELTEEDLLAIKEINAKLYEELRKQKEVVAKLQGKEAEQNLPKRTVDILGMSDEDWSTLFKNTEGGLTAVEKIGKALQAVGNIFGDVSNLMSASEARDLKEFEKNQDKKKKSLDRQLKSGQISQEAYHTRVQKLDDETDAKREEMERKQAERQKALALFQAIVSTAVAVINTLAAQHLPYPLNVIMAGVVGALGAVQIAAIAAQPLPGAEEGGMLVERTQDGQRFNAQYDPKRRGAVSSPTVIVGEGGTEYVVPAEGYANPTVRPVLDMIEVARRSGSLSSVNLTALMASNMSGRAVGGSIATQPTPAPVSGTSAPWSSDLTGKVIAVLEANEAATAKLLARLDGPIAAEVSVLGRKGIVENLEKYTSAKNRTTIQ